VPERRPAFFAVDDFIVHVQRIVPYGLLRFVGLDGMTGNVLRVGLVPIEPDTIVRHLLIVYGCQSARRTAPLEDKDRDRFRGRAFYLASYMIEGGASRTYIRTKRMMYSDEILWRRLMGKIVDVQAPFASLQVSAGARCIQVFDSWVGALGPDDYVRFVQPYSRALIERIRATGVPVIHFGTGASGFFRELHAAGGDVMGVDWRINIDQAWMDISYRSAIQGNLDPVALFAPLPELRAKVHELLKRTGVRPGHIFNLGHGILPETPVENVKAVVEMVREFRP